MLANNLIASASLDPVCRISTESGFFIELNNIFKKFLSWSDLCPPKIILEGLRLSFKADPSLKNSGEKLFYLYYF